MEFIPSSFLAYTRLVDGNKRRGELNITPAFKLADAHVCCLSVYVCVCVERYITPKLFNFEILKLEPLRRYTSVTSNLV
jgi:hypothetical protein